jgi:hypothetical protein
MSYSTRASASRCFCVLVFVRDWNSFIHVAARDAKLHLAMLRTSGISYYEQDGNGAVTSLSDSGGALVSTYAYDSYGKMTSYAELWLDACRLCSGRFAVTGLAIKGAVGFCIYAPRMLLAGISMCPIKRRSTDFNVASCDACLSNCRTAACRAAFAQFLAIALIVALITQASLSPEE